MTTQTEALKMALEALETYRGYMEPLLTVFGGPRVPAEKSTTYKVEKAIIAIKEALAQQSNEQVEPDCWAESDKEGNIVWGENCFSDDPEWLDNPMPLFSHPPVPYVTESRTAQPKEPEQEPVAWITNNGDGWLRWHRAKDNNSNSIPLYTTPPQRTWVGLTDDERKTIAEANNALVDDDLFDEIEAKLKEKNT